MRDCAVSHQGSLAVHWDARVWMLASCKQASSKGSDTHLQPGESSSSIELISSAILE